MSTQKKVLLVEDEFILYEQLTEFFESEGFKVAGKRSNSKPIDTYDKAIEILHTEEPDFAVLDIKIKSDKDGLDVGNYIRQHFTIPIIFLSEFDNYQNMERVSNIEADGFITKHEKPFDKQQLRNDIYRLRKKIEETNKHRSLGRFMKVKEINSNFFENKHKKNQSSAEPFDIELYLKWEEVKMIVTNNKVAKNNIIIHNFKQNKNYIHRSSLNEIELMLPYYFVRTDQSVIINMNAITGKGKSEYIFYLNDMRIEISDKYRKAALQKINLYLRSKI